MEASLFDGLSFNLSDPEAVFDGLGE